MKVCGICGKKKMDKSFNKNAATKDGLQSKCRDCERVYRIKNKKHIVKRRARYNAMKRAEKLRDRLASEELNESVNSRCQSTQTDSNLSK
jgi:hypothetical protein